MLTLEEAISHAEEVAEEQDVLFKGYDEASRHYRTHNEVWESYFAKKSLECFECAKEHRQLAEWLRELVHLRNITEYLRDMVTCFEFMDSMHYNEDIIEWAESELRVDMREVNADED